METKAQSLLESTRNSIKEFIVFELRLFCTAKNIKPNYEEGGDIILPFAENFGDVPIQVFVYDTYLDGNYAFYNIEKIIVTLDDNIYVEMEDLSDDEICWEEIKTDDLAKIADAIEMSYKNMVKVS